MLVNFLKKQNLIWPEAHKKSIPDPKSLLINLENRVRLTRDIAGVCAKEIELDHDLNTDNIKFLHPFSYITERIGLLTYFRLIDAIPCTRDVGFLKKSFCKYDLSLKELMLYRTDLSTKIDELQSALNHEMLLQNRDSIQAYKKAHKGIDEDITALANKAFDLGDTDFTSKVTTLIGDHAFNTNTFDLSGVFAQREHVITLICTIIKELSSLHNVIDTLTASKLSLEIVLKSHLEKKHSLICEMIIEWQTTQMDTLEVLNKINKYNDLLKAESDVQCHSNCHAACHATSGWREDDEQ